MTISKAARLNASMTPAENASLLDGLRKVAADQMAAFPQYAGRFEKMALGRAKRDVSTKLGLAMKKGEPILIEAFPSEGLTDEFVTIWSFRNRCLTQVRAKDVVPA